MHILSLIHIYNWADVVWLRTFFKENIDDLNAYFKITDIKEAISDTTVSYTHLDVYKRQPVNNVHPEQ